jgi:altronate dehydratase small subunit
MTKTNFNFVVLNRKDNVAVALEEIPSEVTVLITDPTGDYEIRVKDTIQFGHKFAIKTINHADYVLKYGEVIGRSMRKIEPGEHVHIHNLEGNRGRGDQIGQNQ